MASPSKASSASINNPTESYEGSLIYQNSIILTGQSDEKRNRPESGILLQTMSADHQSISHLSSNMQRAELDDDQDTVSHYANHRVKEERFLFITNIFRLLVVIILAFLIYFQI